MKKKKKIVDQVDANILDERYARIIHLNSSEKDEFEAKRILTERLTDGCNVVAVLCGGTEENHGSELSRALALGWPVFALEDTKGFAEQVAGDVAAYSKEGGGKLIAVPHLTSPSEIASCLHVSMVIDL